MKDTRRPVASGIVFRAGPQRAYTSATYAHAASRHGARRHATRSRSAASGGVSHSLSTHATRGGSGALRRAGQHATAGVPQGLSARTSTCQSGASPSAASSAKSTSTSARATVHLLVVASYTYRRAERRLRPSDGGAPAVSSSELSAAELALPMANARRAAGSAAQRREGRKSGHLAAKSSKAGALLALCAYREARRHGSQR